MKKILAFVLAAVMLLTSMVTTTVQVFADDDGNEQTTPQNTASDAGEGVVNRDVSDEETSGDTIEIGGIFRLSYWAPKNSLTAITYGLRKTATRTICSNSP
ncbi:MAG: hypothetical protein J6T77_05940 [Clostridia bacterium]|nr:hypothetical protein [Clostridia bacterium]